MNLPEATVYVGTGIWALLILAAALLAAAGCLRVTVSLGRAKRPVARTETPQSVPELPRRTA
jgi:hypothetical protein